MARKTNKFPITVNELLFIIAIFLIAFGGIFNSIILFFIGAVLLVVLIIEKFFGVIIYPNKSKEFFDY